MDDKLDRESRREYQAAYAAKKRAQRPQKYCKCGEPIAHNRTYCADCRKQREKNNIQRQYNQRREDLRKLKHPITEEKREPFAPRLSPSEIDKLAKAEGLTYGQACVKHKLYPWLNEPANKPPVELTYNQVRALAAEQNMPYTEFAKSIGL